MSDIKQYIKIYDIALPKLVINSFVDLCEKKLTFQTSKIVGESNTSEGIIDTEVRNVKEAPLTKHMSQKTITHWFNLWTRVFADYIKRYSNDFLSWPNTNAIHQISTLRYEPGGHYNTHVDHGTTTPRTLSCILFLNDNFKGGRLIFEDIVSKEKTFITPKQGRLIIWPSNYLYPHCVEPVEEGIRYCIVSWAL